MSSTFVNPISSRIVEILHQAPSLPLVDCTTQHNLGPFNDTLVASIPAICPDGWEIIDVPAGVDPTTVLIRETEDGTTEVTVPRYGTYTFNCGGVSYTLEFVSLLVVTGRTYEGSFRWFGYLPYDFVPGEVFGAVPERYLRRTAGGSNTQLQSQAGRPPTQPISGSIFNTFGGTQEIDPTTGAQSGMFVEQSFLSGILCRGSSYAYITGTLNTVATTTGPLDNIAFNNTFITNFGMIDRLTWGFQGYEQPGPGYSVTYCGAGVNGVTGDTITESLSNRMTVAQAAAAGGAHLIDVTYDSRISAYNTGTGEMAGRSTEINITHPTINPSGFYLIDVHLTKTPDVGAPVEKFVESISVNEGPGGMLNFDYIIPQQAGFTIALDYAEVSMFSELSDDFEAQNSGWFSGQSSKYVKPLTWANAPIFDMLAPYTECSADWEDSPDQLVGTPMLTDTTGYYWASTGKFSAVDGLQTSDDFENYSAGVIPALQSGTGFAGPGFFLASDNLLTVDDFESYATGIISLLTLGTNGSPTNCWIGNGTFAT